MPSCTRLGAVGYRRMLQSEWEWMSINPGLTIFPDASIVDSACSGAMEPTARMVSPTIPRSPDHGGPPVPSRIAPPQTTRSKAVRASMLTGGVSARPATAAAPCLSTSLRVGLRIMDCLRDDQTLHDLERMTAVRSPVSQDPPHPPEGLGASPEQLARRPRSTTETASAIDERRPASRGAPGRLRSRSRCGCSRPEPGSYVEG